LGGRKGEEFRPHEPREKRGNLKLVSRISKQKTVATESYLVELKQKRLNGAGDRQSSARDLQHRKVGDERRNRTGLEPLSTRGKWVARKDGKETHSNGILGTTCI